MFVLILFVMFVLFLCFQSDLEDMFELSEMRQELMDRVQTIMSKAQEYRNSFDNYAYLWVDDRKEFMRQFLLYNHVLTTEEIEAHAEDGVPECPPTLDQFKEQVCVHFFCPVLSYHVLSCLVHQR